MPASCCAMLLAYAASLGLRPHRGFAAIEQLFGDVRAEDCRETFAFGHDGKPLYVVGPTESTEQVVRRLGRLADRLGPEGFDFVIPTDDLGDDGDWEVDTVEPQRDRLTNAR